ncbi:hypothetical protein ACR77J_07405 [Tissierella praeacuta]|uniref:hypothetical protein n=1 Tax=Tissierella praeacuta TaxID=43131 RepID=UPI003DA566CA
MKIKASVKLIWKTDYYSEELRYKIKYKIGNQKRYNKINQLVATSRLSDWAEYIDKLYEKTRKGEIITMAKKMIEGDIIKRGENIKLNNKHNQILQDIKNINKEKIEFEFEVE